jgi:hypothetical protein
MHRTKPRIAGMLRRAVTTVLALATPAALYAQSCAMCYQSAAASGPRSIHALKLGILILMFPPLLITGGVFYLAYRKRDQFNQNSERVIARRRASSVRPAIHHPGNFRL